MNGGELELVVVTIRRATREDADAIWKILEPVIRAGETYTLPREMIREDALAYWFAERHEVFVAAEGGEIVGTYFLRANQQGGRARSGAGDVRAFTRTRAGAGIQGDAVQFCGEHE